MKLSKGNGDDSAYDNAHQSSETLPDPSTEFPEQENHDDDKDRQSEPLRTSVRRVCRGHGNSIDDSIDRWLPATDPVYGNAHQRKSQQCVKVAADDLRKELKNLSHQRCDQNTKRAGDQERPIVALQSNMRLQS